jgi:hypothetical protein
MTLRSAAALLALAAAAMAWAQVQYARGQDVAPVFEGWLKDPDGTFRFVFGYLNRNFQEEVEIPVGPDNAIEPGGDRGQPTHFYPRRQRFLFGVKVPADWDPERRVVWTLSARGKTNQAKGWLHPEWELNDGVIAENNGGGALAPGNRAPSITTGSTAMSAEVGSALMLLVTAADDGLPRGRLRIQWSVYRGSGGVALDPESRTQPASEPLLMPTRVVFDSPGLYVLRATASDGQLFATHDVPVTVR